MGYGKRTIPEVKYEPKEGEEWSQSFLCSYCLNRLIFNSNTREYYCPNCGISTAVKKMPFEERYEKR